MTFAKKSGIILGLLFVVGGLVWILKKPLLKTVAGFLVKESSWQNKTYDYAIILGGQPEERGRFAAELYHKGRVRHLVCLGGNYPRLLRLAEDTCSEGRLTALQLLKLGVPDSCLTVISEGTSTKEELAAFLKYYSHKEGTLLLVSSRFHTRRVHMSLRMLLGNPPRKFDMAGAPSILFDESNWWRHEEGLITINNEYLKLLYYLYKY